MHVLLWQVAAVVVVHLLLAGVHHMAFPYVCECFVT